jgi:hypothetical protein
VSSLERSCSFQARWFRAAPGKNSRRPGIDASDCFIIGQALEKDIDSLCRTTFYRRSFGIDGGTYAGPLRDFR